MSGAWGLVTSANHRLEHVFGAARHLKNVDLGAGWPDVESYACAASGLNVTLLQFARTEAFREQFHMAHGVDLSKGTCHVDLHYCMSTADSGKTVKMKLSVWLLDMASDQDLSALSTPDDTYTWTITPNANDYVLDSAYIENAIDLSAVAARKEIHSHLGIRLERLDSGDGDNHGGDFCLLRGEISLPMGTGEMILPS